MPGIQGPELAGRVRPTHPELPVLFVSGFTDRARSQSLADDPRSVYLATPFRHGELARAIRALLDQEQRPAYSLGS